MTVTDQLHKTCASLEQRLVSIPGLITTEADAQAELHAAILDAFPEPISIEADPSLLRYSHHTWPLQGCRAYREISAGSSRATARSDIVLLRDESQTLVPKSGGAPARFHQPAACLIEVKLDVGRSARAKVAHAVERDFSKWAAQLDRAEADNALAIIFTDRPETYRSLGNPGVLAIECSATRFHAPVADEPAREALRDAIAETALAHRARPLAMLREKDFETCILRALRNDPRLAPANVVSQHRLLCSHTNRLRPLDIAVFGNNPNRPCAVAELKTSHSATFRTLGRGQLEDEAAFLDGLADEGSRVEVAIFRYGSASATDDQVTWRTRWPKLSLTYAVS